MRRSPAVLVSLVVVVVGTLGGCGRDAAADAPGSMPAASAASAASAAEPAEESAGYPTRPAVVVRGEGEMPPPTDDQRQWLEDLTSGGIPEATIEDVQRQDVLSPALDVLTSMPGYAWSDVYRADVWDASVAFAGEAPQEALDVLRALPVDVRVVQGVLLTEDGRAAAQDAACTVVFEKPGGVGTGSCGTDQESLLVSIGYSGQVAPDPADLQERALAAARATVQDPVARDVLDVVVTHRDEPVGGDDVGPA